MTLRKLVLAAALALTTGATAMAADYKVGQIEVDDLWVRASAPGQENGAGYLEIENDAKTPDRLVSVSSAAAERVELHTVKNENGMARMREVDGGIEVPADGKVELRPGGYHVMFLKLKTPFAEGGTVPATLKFEKAGEVQVNFKVKPVSHNPGMDHGHMKH
ncbi:copper chaperone PCu(A)C [Bordetella pseudohinzii]|uniref:Uncharacterized protein conserved in bacteria n=1 Tax=Bordetella pseudohinzii TaxID=1331258 RepID=A0A0J6BXM7_9BORD|nr:copper chaperone PCu(A)C [Bordetella pseudohinzii]ANY17887.1 hypothetical protein BBN53_19555 [Bordetella pseudohinzii]KMM26469.1 membrane protein [Bordetella pseudohinzii]KXA77051.1 hypothetical protein AW878_16570 [Bordetella pseudohinzii]KXA80111.1 hypothetical protein AW877_07400 [Bordetella pseudohinzii]CUI78644.1 Uncharacterized protein conserved in bacteria [Bordetella pseudohinzii]